MFGEGQDIFWYGGDLIVEARWREDRHSEWGPVKAQQLRGFRWGLELDDVAEALGMEIEDLCEGLDG